MGSRLALRSSKSDEALDGPGSLTYPEKAFLMVELQSF